MLQHDPNRPEDVLKVESAVMMRRTRAGIDAETI